MKNSLFLVTIVSLAIITGSIASYYLIILPKQNIKSQEDINAIREVIAPTPEQQKVQQQRQAQQNAQSEKALTDYINCQIDMVGKSTAYLQQQCSSNLFSTSTNPFDPDTITKNNECTTRVMNSAEYKKFNCPKPF